MANIMMYRATLATLLLGMTCGSLHAWEEFPLKVNVKWNFDVHVTAPGDTDYKPQAPWYLYFPSDPRNVAPQPISFPTWPQQPAPQPRAPTSSMYRALPNMAYTTPIATNDIRGVGYVTQSQVPSYWYGNNK